MELNKMTRKRLFQDLQVSPQQFKDVFREEDFHNLITPCGKGDSALKLEFPEKISVRRSRKSLFRGKRPADDDIVGESPMSKKIRQELESVSLLDSDIKNDTDIISVVERLATKQNLVADGTRDYILPTIPGKHSDLKSISAETLSDVMNGKYDIEISRVTIVDCRYPYEYDGGHIQGAINLYTKDNVYNLLNQPVTEGKPHILVFHCEFSSERGPKMYRFLRNEDRQLNKDNYPKLNYPEVYLLYGGYKEFHLLHKGQCEPMTYKPMLHTDHGEDLRHFRRKSKSWTAGEKLTTSRSHKFIKSKFRLEF